MLLIFGGWARWFAWCWQHISYQKREINEREFHSTRFRLSTAVRRQTIFGRFLGRFAAQPVGLPPSLALANWAGHALRAEVVYPQLAGNLDEVGASLLLFRSLAKIGWVTLIK